MIPFPDRLALKLVIGIGGHFEAVNGEHPVDRRVWQRQAVVSDKGSGVRSVWRPVHHPLGGRHEGEEPLGFLRELAQIGSGKADAEHPVTRHRRPASAQPLGNQTPGDQSEAFGVKGP